MGYLLKEALKTLCGVNQWSYAVFWKIGFQNPKLLIWEDYFLEPKPSSILPSIPGCGNTELPYRDWEGLSGSNENCSSQQRSQTVDTVVSLINKMMINSQVNVVGEGIVGRAAFTGNYLWILASNYIIKGHPPEVLAEMHHQFEAGMQTVAVIPVLPHGVVQLGSSSAIMENIGFVNDVKSLILQLGCMPGSLFADDYSSKEPAGKIGICSSLDNASSNYQGSSGFFSPNSSVVGQPSHPLNQNQGSSELIASLYQGSNIERSQAYAGLVVDPNSLNRHGIQERVVEPEVVSLNPPDAWLKQHGSSYTSGSVCKDQHSHDQAISQNDTKPLEQGILSSTGLQKHMNAGASSLKNSVASQLKTEEHAVLKAYNDSANGGSNFVGGSKLGVIFTKLSDKSATSQEFSNNCHYIVGKHAQNEVDPYNSLTSLQECAALSNHVTSVLSNCENVEDRGQCLRSANREYEDMFMQPSSGDDLFDVLGADFKNKLLSGCRKSFLMDGPDATVQNAANNMSSSINVKDMGSDLYSQSESVTDYSGILSGIGTDNLLDAVVSRAQSVSKQYSDDNLSCGTTVTKISSSSVPSSTPTFGRLNVSDQSNGNFLNLPKQLAKGGALGTSSFISGCSKDDPGSCSQTSSLFGSQISSWVEQGQSVKRESSVSTAYSKKPDETSKSSRKRLKPGENPRPRPKDRQMIQDRVKELREIVPNGAKCSIDALLERTIKHMLFLQSVTKHADKLKQTGESKIINKDGGLLLKDNFEGGATWAFEVGSQSMVCPIIVEDLNPPRQMLVEMLCEERGFFLEIADLIRGLGLTILKGVMEARNGKIWARFAVEANRDVTRMEIFMSLVRLLEQTMKGSASSSVSPIDNTNMIVQHSLPTAGSIPATGGAATLQ